jgi:hypothetical protein
MKAVRALLLVMVSGGMGAVVTFLLVRSRDATPDRWITMKDGGIAYSNTALFESDINLPEMTARHGSVKFVKKPGGQAYQLGYRLKLTVAALDVKSIPAKYRSAKTTKTPSGSEWTEGPLEQVVYDVTAEFELKDADSFVLQHVESKPFSVTSGQQNDVQELAMPPIQFDVVRRTKLVDFRVSVEKCLSCR